MRNGEVKSMVMNDFKNKEKFFKCSCHGEGMLVTKFEGEDLVYFSFWRQGIDPCKLSWKMRIKLFWMIFN